MNVKKLPSNLVVHFKGMYGNMVICEKCFKVNKNKKFYPKHLGMFSSKKCELHEEDVI